MVCGTYSGKIKGVADTHGHGNIRTEDAVFIFQRLSELRQLLKRPARFSKPRRSEPRGSA
ncbi:Uncharacterized protein dnm_011700 [Desulfonema magnum]|uniref:Uncharacterized protein n=1 Tax=Desulfonema magnum TaxID=45655 RepID=A0A975BHJ8_9BACT|nr:Uncharacterized protein dnm_011700 [Desulfonema magnum]